MLRLHRVAIPEPIQDQSMGEDIASKMMEASVDRNRASLADHQASVVSQPLKGPPTVEGRWKRRNFTASFQVA